MINKIGSKILEFSTKGLSEVKQSVQKSVQGGRRYTISFGKPENFIGAQNALKNWKENISHNFKKSTAFFKFSSSSTPPNPKEAKKTEEVANPIDHNKHDSKTSQKDDDTPINNSDDLEDLLRMLEETGKNEKSVNDIRQKHLGTENKEDHSKMMRMADEAASKTEESAIPSQVKTRSYTLQQIETVKNESVLMTFQSRIGDIKMNPGKKLRFSEKTDTFVAKDKKSFFQRTNRHHRSEKTIEKVITHLEFALKEGITEVKEQKIDELINDLEKTTWGKKILPQNKELENKLRGLKESVSIIEKLKETRKVEVPTSNESDREIMRHLIDMAPSGKGDQATLAALGVATQEVLLDGYRNMHISTEDLFKNINTILSSNVHDDIKSEMVNFTIKWLQLPHNFETAINSEVKKQIDGIIKYCDANEKYATELYINTLLSNINEHIKTNI